MTAQTPATSDQHYRAKATGKWASFWCAFFVVMLVAGCSSAESSGELDGDSSPPPPAGYAFLDHRLGDSLELCVNGNGGPLIAPPLIDTVRQAVALWQQSAGGRIPLEVGGACPDARPDHKDGVSVVGWGSLDSAIGLAHRWWSRGRVKEADITLLDTLSGDTLSPPCLLQLMLHETGHVIGLGHQEDELSVMTPQLNCLLAPVPSERDTEAVQYLYAP